MREHMNARADARVRLEIRLHRRGSLADVSPAGMLHAALTASMLHIASLLNSLLVRNALASVCSLVYPERL